MVNLDTIESNLEAIIDKNAKDDDTKLDDNEEVYKIHSYGFDVFDDGFVDKTNKM